MEALDLNVELENAKREEAAAVAKLGEATAARREAKIALKALAEKAKLQASEAREQVQAARAQQQSTEALRRTQAELAQAMKALEEAKANEKLASEISSEKTRALHEITARSQPSSRAASPKTGIPHRSSISLLFSSLRRIGPGAPGGPSVLLSPLPLSLKPAHSAPSSQASSRSSSPGALVLEPGAAALPSGMPSLPPSRRQVYDMSRLPPRPQKKSSDSPVEAEASELLPSSAAALDFPSEVKRQERPWSPVKDVPPDAPVDRVPPADALEKDASSYNCCKFLYNAFKVVAVFAAGIGIVQGSLKLLPQLKQLLHNSIQDSAWFSDLSQNNEKIVPAVIVIGTGVLATIGLYCRGKKAEQIHRPDIGAVIEM